jgi:hypothetical protein
VIEAKDAENAMLRAELEAQLERYRRLELRVVELERRLGSDSTTSGCSPGSKKAGFDDAVEAAWERAGAGRRRDPVNLVDPHAGLAEADAGAPHVLVVRTITGL